MPIVNKNEPFTFYMLKKNLAELSQSYPFLEVFPLGKSCLMHELYCIRWGEGKTKIFINGAHHGLEWITALLLTYFVEELSEFYTKDKISDGVDIKKLYKNVSYYICPMVNPDGVNLAICGLTREIPPKIREKLLLYNNNSTNFSDKWQANIRGVDLNHNYDACFYEGKEEEKRLNIFRPSATRFSGRKPESEPESHAIAEFTRKLRPDIAIAYHTQGREIYYSFCEKEPKEAKKIGEKMAQLSGYKLSEPEGMASFSGYKDWVIDKLGIPAYTIEAGFGKNPLPLSDFDKIYAENRKMLVRLFTDCLQNKH